MLADYFRLVWQQEFAASFCYSLPGFRFIGSGGFWRLGRES